jgi:hypothetical protein
VAALLAATSLGLALSGGVKPGGEADLRAELPAVVGPWRGAAVLYCPDTACPGASGVEAGAGSPCPSCGRALHEMTPGEKNLLPADTRIVRSRYRRADGRELVAAVVLMGADRTSIHNPFICLRGQGHGIVRVRRLRVPLDGASRPFELEMLDLTRIVNRPDGPPLRDLSCYAYWFAGGGHETSSRLRMLTLMTLDRIILGRADRWAYVSVFAGRTDETDGHAREVTDFAAQLHPLLAVPRRADAGTPPVLLRPVGAPVR